MAVNYTNKTVRVVTNDKLAVPFTTAGTGTIAVTGTGIVGDANCLFLTELRAGSWLVDLDNDEFRVVARVDNNNVAHLKQAFSSDITEGSSFIYIPQSKATPREVSLAAQTGTFDLTTNETTTVPEGAIITDSRINGYDLSKPYVVNPCIVDVPADSTVIIEILY